MEKYKLGLFLLKKYIQFYHIQAQEHKSNKY